MKCDSLSTNGNLSCVQSIRFFCCSLTSANRLEIRSKIDYKFLMAVRNGKHSEINFD